MDTERDHTDELLRAVNNPRRRDVVTLVGDGERDVEGVADRLSGDGRMDHRHVAIGLRHIHLPRLRSAGVIDYDEDTGDVAPGEAFERARDVMEAAGDDPDE